MFDNAKIYKVCPFFFRISLHKHGHLVSTNRMVVLQPAGFGHASKQGHVSMGTAWVRLAYYTRENHQLMIWLSSGSSGKAPLDSKESLNCCDHIVFEWHLCAFGEACVSGGCESIFLSRRLLDQKSLKAGREAVLSMSP